MPNSYNPDFRIIQVQGTRKNRQFIPVGNNIQMSCVSGDSGRADLINTPGVNIVPGPFCTCLYFGIVNSISHENAEVNFKFMHPNGPSVHFFLANSRGHLLDPCTGHYLQN